MRTTRQYDVTLPHDVAELIEQKIGSGAYASASDVIEQSLRVLLDRDTSFEHWLQDEAALSYDEHKADPSAAIPADHVMMRIRARGADGRVAGKD